MIQRLHAAGGEGAVDQVAQPDAEDQHRSCGQDQRGERRRDLPAVWPQKTHEAPQRAQIAAAGSLRALARHRVVCSLQNFDLPGSDRSR